MSIDHDNREDDSIRGAISIDKILFACVSSYFLGMVLWISGNEHFGNLQVPFSGETAHPSEADARFIDYIRRSLLVIDNQQKQSQVSQGSQSSQVSQSPQPTPLSSTSPSATPLDSKQLDNVYVPLPTFQQPTLVMPPPPPPVAKSSVPVPPSLPKPIPSPVPIDQTPVSVKLPPPPPAPAPPRREKPTTVPILGSNPSPIPQIPTSGETGTNFGYSLVGLMESGDKSTALFDIKGITQRVNLGEEIGSSGWSLLSVSNQQAVVSKGAETRFIYVGNKF